MKVTISVGKSRKELKWKPLTLSWDELCTKLANPFRSRETYAEYLKMPKAKQDEIKDVGGFVGGRLKDGKRGKGNVVARSLLTLDVDFAPIDFIDDVKLININAMAIYSTHKHSKEKPRLRLVIPLTREVSPEEYEAVARRVADDYNIEYFDDTTYEPERLMYWPSASSDAEYVFEKIDAPFLNPDDILNLYDDWKDTSTWPESSRVHTERKQSAEKQGDPLSKDGLIGAFCRTYTIQEAINTFLPDRYIEAVGGRFTYADGSTAGGLVIYDDKFAYSHHSTDPIGGQLVNAFDLVRLHKFSDLDTNPDLTITKQPSYLKMFELMQSDEMTKQTLIGEKIDDAKSEFDVFIEDLDWTKKLEVGKKGDILTTSKNLLLILNNDPKLNGLGRKNSFVDRAEIEADLPWNHGPYWGDGDDVSLRIYLENKYGIQARQKIDDAVNHIFKEKSYHPVRDYLNSLTWDGKARVEKLLVDYLGSPHTEYVRVITRKTLVAAVARVFNPGCKFDYMLTIVGEQGIGKSLIAKKLGGDWFTDSIKDISGKEAYEALDGKWIVEMGELAALKKSERESIKAYISKQEDSYRKAYDRRPTINPRQNIFIGTTNDSQFLNDSTGNRRYWVVDTDENARTKTVWDDFTDEERDQVWAEALHYYKQGENIMHLPSHILEIAERVQEAYSEENSWTSAICDFLDKPIPPDWYEKSIEEQRRELSTAKDFGGENCGNVRRDKVCKREIWVHAFNGSERDYDNLKARKITDALLRLKDWETDITSNRYGVYGLQRGFRRR